MNLRNLDSQFWFTQEDKVMAILNHLTLTSHTLCPRNSNCRHISAHLLHHQNATALRYQFQIPRETAREIVRSCLHCPTVYNSLPMGVNPCGLKPNVLWQMDVNSCLFIWKTVLCSCNCRYLFSRYYCNCSYRGSS